MGLIGMAIQLPIPLLVQALFQRMVLCFVIKLMLDIQKQAFVLDSNPLSQCMKTNGLAK